MKNQSQTMLRRSRWLSAAAALAATVTTAVAQNPLLPPTAFVPDGEPDVFEYQGQKRLFIYGSRDERVTAYCGYGHDAWSAPIDDLTQWTNHGEIFNVSQVQEIGYGKVDEQHFGAPDCVYNPVLKKYFLYTFLGMAYKLDGVEGPASDAPGTIPGFGEYGPKCVVAESDSPAGPFVNPRICDWPALNGAGAFDPSVAVVPQADGTVRVYTYWGMRKGDCWAELDPSDMCTIIDGRTRKPDRTAWYRTLNNPELNRHTTLFEASSIKQVAPDKFVFICSSNQFSSALTYFYSNSPEGPWTYGGIIVENRTGWRGGNNHGSIVRVGDQWYVVYHRSTCNDYNRQAMIEPIEVRIEGDRVVIPQVEMTSQGIFADGLDPFRRYYAGTIAYQSGGYIAGSLRQPDGLNPVVVVGRTPAIGWKYFNFDALRSAGQRGRVTLKLHMQAAQADARMKIFVIAPEDWGKPDRYRLLYECSLSKHLKVDGEFHEVKLPMSELLKQGVDGKKALLIQFDAPENKEVCRLKEIEFTRS